MEMEDDVIYTEEEEAIFRSLFEDPTSPLYLFDGPEPQGNIAPSNTAAIRAASPQPPVTDPPQLQQQIPQEYRHMR